MTFRKIIAFALAEIAFAGTLPAEEVVSACDDESSRQLIDAREHARLLEGLRDVLARRDAFLSEAPTLSEAERSRRANDVASRFEILVDTFPDAVPALFSFAKFLCDGGETERAESLLLRAEKYDPDFAPVQFLLAEVLAERGKFSEAFPRYFSATKKDPGDAAYRYAFGAFFLKNKNLPEAQKWASSQEEFDALLQNELRAACALAPLDAGFRLAYAESFFSVEKPDWARALAAWDAVIRGLATAGTAEDAATTTVALVRAKLRRAAVLAKLGRFSEAESEVEKTAGRVPAMEHFRRETFNFIREEKERK